MNLFTAIDKKNICLFFVVLLFVYPIYAQKTVRIFIESANSLEYDISIGENVNRFVGNVIFRHDKTYLYCDSAYLYVDINSVDAYGNVQIKASDTSNIYGNVLKYDGNTGTAKISGNVKLIDNQITLITDTLVYNTKTKIASYPNNGIITDLNNNLSSKKGVYYSDLKQFYFYDNVVLVNPEYKVYTDTLIYNTLTAVAYFKGPTTIISDENIIYCEKGFYDTEHDISGFTKNAYLKNKNQILKADSIYYDRNLQVGLGFKNVNIFDSLQKIIIYGNYAEYHEIQGLSYVTDSAMLAIFNEGDTLFLHADTLLVNFNDSTKQGELLKAYYHVKFFRDDFQGMCDSLIYNFSDSTIILYKNPILWTEENQFTAEEIKIWLQNDGKVDSLLLYKTAFIVSKDDIDKFNQIKGNTIKGYFRNNELDYILVEKNAETVYYVRDDSSAVVGINVASALNMIIYIENNKAKRITFIQNASGIMYPEKKIPDEEKILKGFKWYEKERPLSKEDIFSKD
ncbi:MAG TPA: OstA-like protein [Bacteroidales bacterium]|nr:OstA-like protein [Bacteroidales bacterium]